MAYGLNKAMLIGNLGADPELKYTTNSVPVLNLRLATNESYKGQDGQLVERTEWHNIVAYRKAAETLAQYTRKGSKLYIEGKLQTRNYDDKSGVKHYITEIIVDDFMFLDAKGNGGGMGSTQRESAAYTPKPEDDKTDLPF